jgi:tetratricopeptide (TPR) repeat protein
MEDIERAHRLLRSDPRCYLNILNQEIADLPDDPHLYYQRHKAWMAVGEPRKALDDICRAIELAPTQSDRWSRGDVYRHLGEYGKAAADYAEAEAMDPERWTRNEFPLLYQADVHARLGDEPKALACCARLPADFWTPGINNLPAGGKSEIAEELVRRARTARAR